MDSQTAWSKVIILGGAVMFMTGCAFFAPQDCSPPATGQIHWYQNNGTIASCDDVVGFDGPTDVPPGQDGRFTAGCPADGRFEVNGATVIDNCTGLIWQRTSPSGPMTWVEALVFARDLELDGNTDWRLPNANELLTLVDYGRVGPAIDPVFDIPSGDDVVIQRLRVFWSSTSDHSTPGTSAWIVSFQKGEHTVLEKSESRSVRGVRGGSLPFKLPVIICEGVVSP